MVVILVGRSLLRCGGIFKSLLVAILGQERDLFSPPTHIPLLITLRPPGIIAARPPRHHVPRAYAYGVGGRCLQCFVIPVLRVHMQKELVSLLSDSADHGSCSDVVTVTMQRCTT